jgi:predicted GNAT family acetyltransferase
MKAMKKQSLMENVLDNPAWHAMISGNSHLAAGNQEVRYFPEALSPFAGLKNVSSESLKQLFNLVPEGRVVAMVTADVISVPDDWRILYQATLFQMTGEQFKKGLNSPHEIVRLQKHHVNEMLALTQLTNPGPFAERTLEFGHYTGIFHQGRLVAMAGQRLHAFEYCEISAVCTHPDHSGKGYGTALMRMQSERILSSGNIPFLHVRKDNLAAIKIYKHLGFDTRKEMNFYVIQKPLGSAGVDSL